MIKLFRNIRRNKIGTGDMRSYLIYAIGEILLVMIGILLAIQVNNWNNDKIERRNEVKIYKNFKRQISEDLQIIDGFISYNSNYFSQYK